MCEAIKRFLAMFSFCLFIIYMVATIFVITAWDFSLYNPANWHEFIRFQGSAWTIVLSVGFAIGE